MKNHSNDLFFKDKKPVILVLSVLLFFTLLSVVITVSIISLLLAGL